jgi:hypothetical protein
MKNLITISAVALGVYLIFNMTGKTSTSNAQTTTGEGVTLRNIGGFIMDEKGRVWI